MRSLSVIALMAVLGCQPDSTNSELKFDSNKHFEANVVFESLKVTTTTDNENSIKSQIRSWNKYIQGVAGNQYNFSVRLETANIEIKSVAPNDSGFDVEFSVSFLSAVANNLQPGIEFILPKGIDSSAKSTFQESHANCSKYPGSTYWYYYKPKGCVAEDGEDIVKTIPSWTKTDDNSTDKSPEYHKLWADGELTVTYIHANEEEVSDSSLLNYLASLGQHEIVKEEEIATGEKRSEVLFNTSSGKVRIFFYALEGDWRASSADTMESFQNDSKVSDFISYNGHAGLGKNVSALTRNLRFEKGRQYLVWINACQPFSYLELEFFDRVETANPDSTWSKHLDLMSNVRIGAFSHGSDAAAIIKDLVEKKANYKEILAKLPGDAAVVGEQDNGAEENDEAAPLSDSRRFR